MRGFLGRLFRGGSRREAEGTANDPAIVLARDWALARGGKITFSATDRLYGILPDGTDFRYVRAPDLLKQQPDLTLISPGSAGLDILRRNIALRARLPVLRITQLPVVADVLARAAVATPHDGCRVCTSQPLPDSTMTCCAECPLRTGRAVLANASAVRSARIENVRERTAYEYAYRLSVSSFRGRRNELARIAVDASTGERIAPLDDATLRGAVGAPTGDHPNDLMAHSLRAEELLRPSAQAAARLARAQTLIEYLRQQDDLSTTYERLMFETPQEGRWGLKARERALERLAETCAVEVDTKMVSAAALLTPLVDSRVSLRDGSSLLVTVDPCRGTTEPHCAACGDVWKVGARCHEGHITCLACQRECAHCGRRRCSLCVAPAHTACADCGAATCARCAHATARFRHRLRHPAPQHSTHARNAVSSESTLLAGVVDDVERNAGATGDDLCVEDLDAMTPASWRAFLVWFLGESGYTVERTVSQSVTDWAFACRVSLAMTTGNADQETRDSEAGVPVLLAVADRTTLPANSTLSNAQVARMLSRTQSLPGLRRMIITTAQYVPRPNFSRKGHSRNQPDMVIDRMQLARWLRDHHTAHRRAVIEAAAAMDERAEAAARLRCMMVDELTALATGLANRQPVLSGNTMPAQHDIVDRLLEQVTIARQGLAALETLIQQWEGAFTPRATRSGTQEIVATPGELDMMVSRAQHLLAVLHDAGDGFARACANRGVDEWLAAARDELTETCLALAARCQALDPMAWRSFDGVRDNTQAKASVEHLAAANRAAARARKLQDNQHFHDSRVQGPRMGSRLV